MTKSTVLVKTNILLFDLDGTLVNSTAAVEKSWENEIITHNKAFPDSHIDLATYLQTSHGTRTEELFIKYFPELKHDKEAIDTWELNIVKNYSHLGKPIGGVIPILEQLNENDLPWAIITSGTTNLAHSWFKKLFSDIKKPQVFITAHDVSKGKPDPEGYNTAFEKLKKNYSLGDNAKGVVFEDAPTGIKAGVNGGFTVIGIASTFDKEKLLNAGASYVVEDFSKAKISKSGDVVELILEIL